MSRHRVFIYGSCVSRDTFEHFDPDQFELVQYVARQSALSAYTRPVTLVDPPQLESSFQQRMVSGDFSSNLQSLIPEAAHQTDLVLVDLTDERLGAYVLPDGSVITRSTELISSGAENHLPAGSQHLPFGSDQHFQYWSQGIAAVGELVRQHMPHAAVVLLDIAWAERSDSGAPTPASFGISAADANPVFDAYVQVATQALRAEVVSLRPEEVVSSPTHPWGDAPFHYAEDVYLKVVKAITGTEGRPASAATPAPTGGVRRDHGAGAPSAPTRASVRDRNAVTPSRTTSTAVDGPNLVIAGTQQAGADWLARQLGAHPEVFLAKGKGSTFFNRPTRLKSSSESDAYAKAFEAGRTARWRVDCTPDYFWHSRGGAFGPKKPNTAENINELTPAGTPAIVVLREPVARALSAYWHHFSLGRFDLSSGLFQVPSTLGVVDLGFYRRHYEQWASVLGSDRIHVVLYDDLVKDPRAALSQVLSTLGLGAGDDFWRAVNLKPAVAAKPWVKPFQQRGTITEQEVAALFELYRRDVTFVESLLGRKLPDWRDRNLIVQGSVETSDR
ncbi:DUF6270 domain-containing protein [Isoptericola sp. NPDC057653]|uniref:DUF6270 domain-containing protein n=1 Tax=Isoptericola sp. NPDC057653 TaxID=3346195 RepID=UPI0036C9B79A